VIAIATAMQESRLRNLNYGDRDSLGLFQQRPSRLGSPGHRAMHSGFGPRGGEFHRGQDIAAPIGTPIIAASSGTVLDSGPANGYGLWVKIEHAHSVNYQVRA
jgi:murein DD-endopeptidase MepM/ murein hydrolase activator NlpD